MKDFILIITFSSILDGLIIDEKSSIRWVTYNYVIQYKLKCWNLGASKFWKGTFKDHLIFPNCKIICMVIFAGK
jgi:hypothetical protein